MSSRNIKKVVETSQSRDINVGGTGIVNKKDSATYLKLEIELFEKIS